MALPDINVMLLAFIGQPQHFFSRLETAPGYRLRLGPSFPAGTGLCSVDYHQAALEARIFPDGK